MLDKKVTRKQFLVSILSTATLLAASKIPEAIKKPVQAKINNNSYGNHAYGGKSNA